MRFFTLSSHFNPLINRHLFYSENIFFLNHHRTYAHIPHTHSFKKNILTLFISKQILKFALILPLLHKLP
ncbi:hypothetical protein HMPREF9999_00632 [Alloprevotella sp. oral taxon 473 str. F0040]|nr:hypothetical protein HMPREF9999_00632 [Alloprevotella sp. oral taxon 473 str. F0040]